MSIALDIGSNKIRVLETQNSNSLTGQQCPSSYLSIRDTESMREVLDNLGCQYAVCQNYLTIIGEGCSWLSDLFELPSTSLFPEGIIPADDPPARQLLNSIIESFLPVPETNAELCMITVPSNGSRERKNEAKENEEFLKRLIQLRGYQPVKCSQSQALVISELAKDSFTGIGMTFGASTVEASFVSRGVEYVNTSIPNAGNWIDRSLAEKLNSYQYDDHGNRFLDTVSMKKWKESLEGHSLNDSSKKGRTLEGITHQLLDQVIELIDLKLTPVIQNYHFNSPIILVVTGGTARIPGFGKMLKEKIDQANLSIEINRVKIAIDSEYTVARGLLIQSILESEDQQSTGSIAA